MGLISNAMTWLGGKPWPRSSASREKPIVDWRPGIELSTGQMNGSANGYSNGYRPHPADPRIMPPANRNRQSNYDSDLASMSMTRSYDAATPTQGTADWLAWSTSGSFEVLYAWRRICYLARDLERNNPHARAFLRELCLNVIGANGIRLQPRVKNLKGKNLNDKLNEQILDGWTEFRAKGVYDVTGQYSGILADNMALRAIARDGGCLIKLHRGFKGNKYRFAVQLLEVDALDLWYNKILENENLVTEGVEMDALGKPIAYHLLKYNESDLMANNTIGQRVRVPAKDMIHAWLPERITSVRGVSWFASVLLKLRMLDKFEEAAAIAKRTTAAKMGFYEREKDAQHYTGQGQTETGEIIEEVSPGTMIELPAGVSFKPFDPGKTEDNYHDFRKAIMRTISGGLGVMYNSLANDLESVNYSTARFGRDLEVMNWRYLQTFWIDTVLQPIFNAWLEMAALAGEIPVTFEQMETVQKSMFWRPRGFPYIDPQKDVEAGTGAISFGLSTHSRELAEQGLDRDEVFSELANDRDAAKKLGLVFLDPRGRNPYLSTQEDPNAVPGTGQEAEDAKVSEPVPVTKAPGKVTPAPKKTTPTTVTKPTEHSMDPIEIKEMIDPISKSVKDTQKNLDDLSRRADLDRQEARIEKEDHLKQFHTNELRSQRLEIISTEQSKKIETISLKIPKIKADINLRLDELVTEQRTLKEKISTELRDVAHNQDTKLQELQSSISLIINQGESNKSNWERTESNCRELSEKISATERNVSSLEVAQKTFNEENAKIIDLKLKASEDKRMSDKQEIMDNIDRISKPKAPQEEQK